MNDRDIVHKLEKQYLIPQDVHNQVLNPNCLWSSREKSGKLVQSIRNKVYLNRDNFYKLLTTFKSDEEKYDDIIKILESEMQKISGYSSSECYFSVIVT